jgi:hypothetical protein
VARGTSVSPRHPRVNTGLIKEDQTAAQHILLITPPRFAPLYYVFTLSFGRMYRFFCRRSPVCASRSFPIRIP